MPRQGDTTIPTRVPPWWESSAQAGSLGPKVEPASESELAQYINETCWKAWLPSNRAWHKQVEENVRMVSGRQYEAFIESVGQFVDLASYFGAGDRLWRENPVFNWLAHYYKLTLSKLTENVPSIGFLPASADYKDAVLAQIMEPVWKFEWTQMSMPEAMFDLYAWVILAARGVSKLRWDPDRGPAEDFRGPAILEMLAGNMVTQRHITDAPYTRLPDGSFAPNVLVDPEGNPLLDDEGDPVWGAPHNSRLGDLAFDVVAPTSVITPAGPEPFHLKPWYTQEYLVPVEDFERKMGLAVGSVDPDDISADEDLHLKLAYGQNYGMPGSWGNGLGSVEGIALKGYKKVREHWRRELPNHPTLSRGRLVLVGALDNKVYYDDINPFWVDGSHEKTVMPFDAWDAIPFPARREGMGDLESLNPIQRAMNRRLAAAMDAVEHFEQPALFYNENALDEQDIDKLNLPGARIAANMSAGIGNPAFRLDAADMPKGSIEMANVLQTWMQTIGSLPFSAEGVPQTTDPSGELQREMRFDVDRGWGATLRLHSYGWARVADKMKGILAACMDDRRLLVLSGEDNAAEFFTVAPDMFSGNVNVVPHPESMVLESRQERQNRIGQLVQGFGLPPEIGLQLLNYPDLNRALRPGGPAYSMAQQENLEMWLGTLPPVLQEQDHAVHLLVHKKQQQTVAYRDAGPQLQRMFQLHVMLHEQMGMAEMARQMEMAGAVDPSAGAPGGGPPKPGSASTAGAPGASSAGHLPPGGSPQTPGAADPRRGALSLSR